MSPSHSEQVERALAEIRHSLAQLKEAGPLPRLLARALDAMDNTLVVTDPTLPDNPLIYVNEQFEVLTGYSYDEAVGRNCRFLQGEDRDQPEIDALRDAVREGRNVRAVLRNYRKDGSMFRNELYLTAVHDGAGKPRYFLGVQNDITELYDAKQEAEGRYQDLFETMTQGVVYQDTRGRIIAANPAAEHLLGLSLSQLQGRASVDPRWKALREDGSPYPGEDHPPMVALRTGEVVSDVVMAIYNPQDDAYRWLSVDAVPQFRQGEDAPYQVYALFDDITLRKEAETERDQLLGELGTRVNELDRTKDELERVNKKLYHNAFHDALTGLPNRLLLTERLERVLKRQVRHQEHTAAVLFMDFDRFKVVNDSLGHAVGDAMLQAVAERLKLCVRPSDTVARLGGDEFVILLENVTRTLEVTRVARRVKDAFGYPIMAGEHELHTSASIGIVTSTAPYTQADEVLRDADLAMYQAKAQKRGGYQLFNAAMHRQMLAAHQLESELRGALQQGELRVAYQPIMAATGTPVGFEALVRWQHPKRGLLSPDRFLAFAEEAGLVRELDFWVWREACAQVACWQRETGRPFTLALNLSSQQFLHADLVDDLERLLQETGFDPANLVLEITEGVLINSSAFVKATLSELKELGIRLYLDDFGTGYSSLAYLQRFPVDALKIDRSFVTGMLEDEQSAELVRTILAMAQALGLAAVAEGVEHEAQLERLRELGCAYTQGFLFAKPLNQTEVVSFLAQTSLN